MVRRRGRPFRRLRSARLWVQRFAFLLLLCTAIGFIIIDRVESPWTRGARTAVTDVVTPLINAVSKPVHAVSDWFQTFESNAEVRRRNDELRAQLARLRLELKKQAGLEAENRELRRLLNVGNRVEGKHITARVLADPGGVYVRSIIIDAGRERGVRRGLAVIAPEGLVGRVVEVGQRSARVMLITDLNSRLPVRIAKSGERAVLAGTNGRLMRLVYIAHGLKIEVGTRLVTSGHGGVLPSGIDVGEVVEVGRGRIMVSSSVPWNRLSFVRVIDYTTPGLVVKSKKRQAIRRLRRRPQERASSTGQQ